jgi:hypothetical protein
MRVSKTQTTVLMIGAVIASRLVACSPTVKNNGSQDNLQGTGAGSSFGGGNGTGNGTGASGYTGSAGDNGGPVFNSGGATQGSGGGTNADCPPVVQKPEEIITYRDASVTDTITTYKPVALFIMQDRSGSMVTGFPPPASADGWKNSSAAIDAFVHDPSSTGIHVGLGSFPPMTGSTDCSGGTDCGTPIVPIGPLPQNAAAMVSGMQTATPNNPIALTPTECGLRGMVNQCTAYKASAMMQCVAVLITDGTPTQCDGTAANLEKIVSDGLATGVTTFVIGLPGSNISALDGLAKAGGTNAAIDVSAGSAAFIAALNKIRGSVSTQSTTHISIPMTISTPLPCEWKIPVPANKGVFDKAMVNVRYTPPGGAAGEDFGYTTVANCASTTNGWYFDDPASPNPAKVLLCPGTCDKVKAQPGAAVEISFNCPQKPAIAK